ncbi:MAG: BatD family protein [Reichenbachiella sp.]
MLRKGLLFINFWLGVVAITHAQVITIELGASEIAINQYFTITAKVHNERFQNYGGFPEIKGFQKRGTSSSSSTNFINGERSSTQSITQNYVALREGKFQLPQFEMTINGEKVRSAGKTIVVGPAKQQQRRRAYDPFASDPFQDLFGRNNSNQNQPQEFVDVKADAFLALTTDKSEVYSGEGFTMTLALYVANDNQAEMRFHELGEQLPAILKKIKPSNCWEENFDIENIVGEPVEIGGKKYNQFKIFQAAYYPLNNETIQLPKVGLELIKYNVAKNRSFFGRNKKEELVTFYTKAKTIRIKEMPDHPLKDLVAVGNYRLDEKISSKEMRTGESFSYNFNIVGEGNVSGINDVSFNGDKNFDLFAPNIRQDIRKSNGKIRGKKAFNIYGIPNEPGDFDMGEYFQWIYFNTNTESYDTLKSKIVMTVTGESKKNEHIMSNDMGSFYETMDLVSNDLFSLDGREKMRTILNIVIFAMIALTVVVMFKK